MGCSFPPYLNSAGHCGVIVPPYSNLISISALGLKTAICTTTALLSTGYSSLSFFLLVLVFSKHLTYSSTALAHLPYRDGQDYSRLFVTVVINSALFRRLKSIIIDCRRANSFLDDCVAGFAVTACMCQVS